MGCSAVNLKEVLMGLKFTGAAEAVRNTDQAVLYSMRKITLLLSKHNTLEMSM